MPGRVVGMAQAQSAEAAQLGVAGVWLIGNGGRGSGEAFAGLCEGHTGGAAGGVSMENVSRVLEEGG